MNILFVCNEYPPAPHGGVGTFVKEMAHALLEKGHSVWVVGMYSDVQSSVQQIEDGVHIHRFPRGNNKLHFSIIQERFKLAKIITKIVKQEKIDLAEAPEGGGWGVFLSPICPWVIRLHNATPLFSTSNRGKFITLLEGLALRRCNRVVSVSQFLLKAAQNLYPLSDLQRRDSFVISNGINTSLFHFFPYEMAVPGRILYAGTIKPLKNIETLLIAFENVWKKYPEVSLDILGKDTQVNGQSYWESLSSKIPIEIRSKITFHGPINHEWMPEYYSKAQVCVFPSAVESFGLATAEAMACGRPVIYSKVGPGPEIINHGVDGFLCNPNNASEIASQIKDVLENVHRAKMVGKNAAMTISERFALSEIVEKNIQFYLACIDEFENKRHE